MLTLEQIKAMSPAQIKTAMDEMAAAKQDGKVTAIKTGEKGGVSVYGLGRFPVTLYAAQWPALFAAKDRIEKYIRDNRDTLKWKD